MAFAYFVYKLLFWNRFSVGVAPLVIGIFFFSSVQLISVGVLGEYIGSIHTQVQKRPYVTERERVNFEYEPGMPKTTDEKAERSADLSAMNQALRLPGKIERSRIPA